MTNLLAVSPSRVGRYFYLECERYLRYSSVPREHLADEGVPEAPYDVRPVHQAVLEGGYAWEERALDEHLRGRVHIGEPLHAEGRVRDRAHSLDATRDLLATVVPGDAIYQATLRPTNRFYRRYGIDPSVVHFTDCRPDLIEAIERAGSIGLRVTDLKASRGLRLSHRIQAALYTLILGDVVDSLGIGERAVELDPAIWLVGEPAPTGFDIRAILPPLEQFLERDLGPLLGAPAADAPWHLQPRCEMCPYFEHCRAEMRARSDVSQVAFLSSHAKRRLQALEPAVRSVGDLADALDDPARAASLDAIGSLRGRRDRLAAQVRALSIGEPVAIGASSLAMPRAEQVRLVLSLQTEPLGGNLYTWAVSAQGLRGLVEPNPITLSDVACTGEPDEIRRLERAIIEALYRILVDVDGHNDATEDWAKQKTLQAYVFDTYERALLTGVLLRGLLDPAVADKALPVFFHFHSPELMEASEHPQAEVPIPLVVLTSVIRSLLALPLEVTYRFVDVVRLLNRTERPFEYRELGYFDYELSNQLRPDALFALWHRGEAERADQIKRVMQARVWAASAVVDGLRERLERLAPGTLFAWPPRFRLAAPLGLRDPILSRLAFIERYESLLGYLDVRNRRMAPLGERTRTQTTIELRAAGGDRFSVVEGGEDVDIEEEGFPDRLLTAATADGERAALLFSDFAYRDKPYGPSRLPLAVAGVRSVERDVRDRVIAVRLDLKPSREFGTIQPDLVYRLDDRYTDYLSERVIAELREIDQEHASRFLALIRDPVGSSPPLGVPRPIRDTALALARRNGMTPSQLDTFRRTLGRPLSLAWGPPGTDKTHYLALAILCLAEAHRCHGKPYAVVVTAFTHAAIDNCLRKLTEIQRERRVIEGPAPVAKLGRAQLEGLEDVEILVPERAGDWLDAHRVAIVGGTVWAIRKGIPPARVDLVVIDEGSQLRVGQAAIAIRRVRPAGRLVIAGDHRQLPPIVAGAYPEDPASGPPLQRSIFEVLRNQDPTDVLTGTLLENFRMNATLCLYPARQLYRPDYRSASPAIAGRVLTLAGADRGDLVDAAIDPAWPLAVIVLEGVQATAENPLEAGLTADLAVRLRERLCAPDPAQPYATDAAFWRRGLFIVSPHHVQIRAIRRALRDRRAWTSRPFVDTVDKMQGQECDAVIASYGVADAEYALNEQEFIYSLNRLNVATTRGRAKTIVLVSRDLLEPPIKAFDDDGNGEGIAFMQGLVRFAEREGVATVTELGGGVGAALYRVPSGPRTGLGH